MDAIDELPLPGIEWYVFEDDAMFSIYLLVHHLPGQEGCMRASTKYN